MDTVGGFMQQPFVGVMLAFVCFFGVVLIVMLAFIFRARAQKASAGSGAVSSAKDADGGELPGLDMLLDTSSLLSDTPARATRSGTFAVNLADGGTVDAVEVMSILRDVTDGHLIVQMSDKAYQSIAGSGDAEFRDRFMKVMRELSQITAQVSKTPVSASAPSAEAPTPPAPPPARPKLASTLPPPPPTAEGALPGDLPKFRLEDQPPPAPPPGLIRGVLGGKKAPSEPVPEINIAGAIEAYLQHRLRNAPDYAGRSIHVHPSPDSGVSIEVDGRYYDAVSEVEDEEVREFIATAIQEWQDRH